MRVCACLGVCVGMSAKAIFSKWYSASSTPDRERDRYEDGREMGAEGRNGEAGDGWEEGREEEERRGNEVESEKTAEDLKEGGGEW